MVVWQMIAHYLDALNKRIDEGASNAHELNRLNELMTWLPVPTEEIGTWSWIRRGKTPGSMRLRYLAHDPDAGWPDFELEVKHESNEIKDIRVYRTNREISTRALRSIHHEMISALSAPYGYRPW